MLSALIEVHDNEGHWAKTGILVKLRGLAYWPQQTKDVKRYIAECIKCARHGPATRSQSLHSIFIWFPFWLLDMNFISPMKSITSGSLYIFHVIDYFSRFSVAYACKTANASDVISSLKDVFVKYATSRAIYCDRGQHFDNMKIREFLGREDVIIIYSPSGSFKSTDMIEVSNRLLEDIVRRSSEE